MTLVNGAGGSPLDNTRLIDKLEADTKTGALAVGLNAGCADISTDGGAFITIYNAGGRSDVNHCFTLSGAGILRIPIIIKPPKIASVAPYWPVSFTVAIPIPGKMYLTSGLGISAPVPSSAPANISTPTLSLINLTGDYYMLTAYCTITTPTSGSTPPSWLGYADLYIP